jgi:DNA polymerase-3 subunit gamma/tau
VSYQVIARKYRPQTFSDLTGQEHITRTLSHALDGDRLHHAYLFSGVRGTGKTTTARILAKGLNCHQGTSSHPCLQCPSCLEIAAGSSMDVLEIDAASNTGVDNVRDVIINNIAMAPARDRFKVFVIDEVHMLSTSAFNALLKTLEEPPAHVIFILATTELHKLPDTILSRCQQFEFRNIPTEKIFGRLREIATLEQVTISDNALREIARAGAGSLRDAQSAFDQVIAFSGNSINEDDVTAALGLVSAATLARFTEAIANQETARLLELVGEIYARGYDARNFTRELMACFRNLLLIHSGITNGELLGLTEVEVARLKELAPRFSEADLVRGFHLLATTEKEIKDSAEPRFQLEMGLVRLAQIRRLRPLEELLTRLEALEKRVGGGSDGPGGGAVSGASAPPVTAPPVGSASAPPASGAPPVAPPPPVRSSPSPAVMPPPIAPPPVARTTATSLPNLPPPPMPRRSPVVTAPAPPHRPGVPRADDRPIPEATLPAPVFDSEPMDMPVDIFNNEDGLLENNPFPEPRRMTRLSDRPPAETAPGEPRPASGGEIEAIIAELQRNNRGLILTALESAELEYQPGLLIATFATDDIFAKRVRESSALFQSLGETLFGQPLRVEIRLGGEVRTAANQANRAEEQRERERQQLHERAMQIPAVREFLEQTRGEIVWVRELKK